MLWRGRNPSALRSTVPIRLTLVAPTALFASCPGRDRQPTEPTIRLKRTWTDLLGRLSRRPSSVPPSHRRQQETKTSSGTASDHAPCIAEPPSSAPLPQLVTSHVRRRQLASQGGINVVLTNTFNGSSLAVDNVPLNGTFVSLADPPTSDADGVLLRQ